jgi:hypothetical protein
LESRASPEAGRIVSEPGHHWSTTNCSMKQWRRHGLHYSVVVARLDTILGKKLTSIISMSQASCSSDRCVSWGIGARGSHSTATSCRGQMGVVALSRRWGRAYLCRGIRNGRPRLDGGYQVGQI